MPTEGSVHGDGLLELSRRVDWRFLLPDPELGEIGYFGSADRGLVDGCRSVGSSLAFGSAGGEARAGVQVFDMVVVVDPTTDLLREAVRRVRPGGRLYIEFHGPLASWRRVLRAPRLPGRCATIVRRLGCEDVQLHWHWPNFERCVEMIPLSSSHALRHALLVRRSSKRGLERAFRRVLVRSPLLQFVAPSVSIVARLPS